MGKEKKMTVFFFSAMGGSNKSAAFKQKWTVDQIIPQRAPLSSC